MYSMSHKLSNSKNEMVKWIQVVLCCWIITIEWDCELGIETKMTCIDKGKSTFIVHWAFCSFSILWIWLKFICNWRICSSKRRIRDSFLWEPKETHRAKKGQQQMKEKLYLQQLNTETQTRHPTEQVSIQSIIHFLTI